MSIIEVAAGHNVRGARLTSGASRTCGINRVYHIHRGSGSVGLGKAPAAWVGKCCRLSGKRSPRTVDLLVRPGLTGAAPTASFFHFLRDAGPLTLRRVGGRGYLPSRNVSGRHLQFQLAHQVLHDNVDALPNHVTALSLPTVRCANHASNGGQRIGYRGQDGAR